MTYNIRKLQIEEENKFYVENEQGYCLVIPYTILRGIFPLSFSDYDRVYFLEVKRLDTTLRMTDVGYGSTLTWRFDSIEQAEKALNIYLANANSEIVKTINV